MRRVTEPTKSTKAFLRKREEVNKLLKKFIRDNRKAQREAKRASQ